MLLGVAREVANLPGAVRAIPAMPFASFLLIIGGGLWLVLIRQGRLRRLAAIPLLLALLPMALAERPAVLIGEGGKIFAVLDGAGEYLISTRRAGRFTRRVWLETYGQSEYAVWPITRKAKTAAADNAGPVAVRCDPVGCVYRPPRASGEKTEDEIVFLFKREGFGTECNRAEVLISRHFAPRDCKVPGLLLDGRVLRREGAMILSYTNGGWRMHSVAAARGVRPWTGNGER
jgi:competence protein ComEC